MRAAYRLLQLWWRVRRPTTVGVRVIAFDDHGKVLLVRHRYGTRQLHLPGGGVRPREPLATAAVRELWEESGIDVPADQLRAVGALTSVAEGKTDHVVVYHVQLQGWPAAEAHSNNIEILEAGWHSSTELPSEVSPATRRRIEEFRAGSLATHHDW